MTEAIEPTPLVHSGESTMATIIIEEQYQAVAQERFPGMFVAGFSESGDIPPTHRVSSGYFYNSELELLVNEHPFPFTLKLGEFSEDHVGLKMVSTEN